MHCYGFFTLRLLDKQGCKSMKTCRISCKKNVWIYSEYFKNYFHTKGKKIQTFLHWWNAIKILLVTKNRFLPFINFATSSESKKNQFVFFPQLTQFSSDGNVMKTFVDKFIQCVDVDRVPDRIYETHDWNKFRVCLSRVLKQIKSKILLSRRHYWMRSNLCCHTESRRLNYVKDLVQYMILKYEILFKFSN